MYSADAARGENFYSGHFGYHHGRGNRRGSGFSGCQINGHIPSGYLSYALGLAHYVKLLGSKADLELSADDGCCGGHGALGSYDLLNLVGEFHVLGEWHAVAQNRALKGYDGFALVNGLLYFRCY